MCMPTFIKCYCKDCHRFYTVSFGDCRPVHIDYRCPYCMSSNYEILPDGVSPLEFIAKGIWHKITGGK